MDFIKTTAKLFLILYMLFPKILNGHLGKERPAYIKYVDEVTNDFIQVAKKEFDLVCIGQGGSMPDDVEKIKVHLVATRRATVNEARELEIKCIETFAEIINAHEKIRPYLREYPFNRNRARVMISFEKPNHQNYTDGSVCFVHQARNKIFYDTEDRVSRTLTMLKEEPYEEALEIVKQESQLKGDGFFEKLKESKNQEKLTIFEKLKLGFQVIKSSFL